MWALLRRLFAPSVDRDGQLDLARCPLCRLDNDCAISAGEGTCWCFTVRVPAEVTAQVPDHLRGAACICRACALLPPRR